MRGLLDTLTFLWWNLDDAKLSPKARDFISDGNNEIFFSAASCWEIAIKYAKGRLTLPETPDDYVANRLTKHRFTPLPIQLSHTLQVYALPDIHQDPFDRLLIVQSQMEGLALLTADKIMAQYNATIIW